MSNMEKEIESVEIAVTILYLVSFPLTIILLE